MSWLRESWRFTQTNDVHFSNFPPVCCFSFLCFEQVTKSYRPVSKGWALPEKPLSPWHGSIFEDCLLLSFPSYEARTQRTPHALTHTARAYAHGPHSHAHLGAQVTLREEEATGRLAEADQRERELGTLEAALMTLEKELSEKAAAALAAEVRGGKPESSPRKLPPSCVCRRRWVPR